MSNSENTIDHLECLFNRSNELEDVEPDVRRWNFHWDTNCDQLITISDVGSWFHYLFFAPGDGILLGILSIDWLSVFLEVGPTDVYGGILSGIFSALIWLGVIGVIADFVSEVVRAIRGYSESG